MSSPTETRRVTSSLQGEGARNVLKDRWLTAALCVTAILYITLLLIRPSGEGWGRGWNMIAVLIYGSPTALAMGLIALWRREKTSGNARKVAAWLSLAALTFPIICMFVIRLKA